jgi:hypothetical protein
MPYNPITLEYHPDEKGKQLMSNDEEAKVGIQLIDRELFRLELTSEPLTLMPDPTVDITF